MKKLLLFIAITITSLNLFAQTGVAINEDNSQANETAILDVKSTTKGMLVPRMTTAQRGIISTPAQGLLVFDLTTESFWFYSNSWIELISNEKESDPVFTAHAANNISNASSGIVISNEERVKLQGLQNNPSGTILVFAGETLPEGYLWCDGAPVLRTEYPELFIAIGELWGVGDGSNTFNTPDLRGYFLRGIDRDNGSGLANIDPDIAERKDIEGNVVGNKVGGYQIDAFQGHWHNYQVNYSAKANTTGVHRFDEMSSNVGDVVVKEDRIKDAIEDGANGSPRTSSETRPKNTYVNYIIKY